MKIKKTRIKQLLKLHLLKLKVYEQSAKKSKLHDFVDSNLNQIIVNLKKALQIIFQYHKAEKRILFIGLPYKLEQKVNQLTQHVSVPKNFDIQGAISNSDSRSALRSKNLNQTCSKKFSRFLLPKLSKKSDLIVLFNHEKIESILLESRMARIPVILFGSNHNLSELSLYNVEGNFKNMLIGFNKTILSISLNFLFKRNKTKTQIYR